MLRRLDHPWQLMTVEGSRRLRITLSTVEISVFKHATESLDKVKEAVLNLFCPEDREQVEANIRYEWLEGVYGNPIVLIRVKVKPPLSDKLVRRIAGKLPEEDKAYLAVTLNRRLDGDTLYIRLDKEAAYLGAFNVRDRGDVIKLVIKLTRRGRNKREVANFLKELGLIK